MRHTITAMVVMMGLPAAAWAGGDRPWLKNKVYAPSISRMMVQEPRTWSPIRWHQREARVPLRTSPRLTPVRIARTSPRLTPVRVVPPRVSAGPNPSRVVSPLSKASLNVITAWLNQNQSIKGIVSAFRKSEQQRLAELVRTKFLDDLDRVRKRNASGERGDARKKKRARRLSPVVSTGPAPAQPTVERGRFRLFTEARPANELQALWMKGQTAPFLAMRQAAQAEARGAQAPTGSHQGP